MRYTAERLAFTNKLCDLAVELLMLALAIIAVYVIYVYCLPENKKSILKGVVQCLKYIKHRLKHMRKM